jgi:HK97 family phage portal protein
VNRFQNRHEFFATQSLNLAVHGNSYARIARGADGRIISLLPLMAPQMEVRTLEDGSVTYLYYTDKGTVAYAAETIWHVKLFGNNTIGLSPLGHARSSLGIAIASEKRVSQVFLNGAKPTGVLMYDKVLKPDQRTQIRQSFKDLAEGNDDSLIVLEAGMKYEQVSMSPQDIELLASRRFQIEDIARFMGVPSVLINDTAGSTTWGSGIQQIIAGWYKLGLRPYLERFETSIEVSLLTDEERGRWEAEFDFDELLRADFGARMEGYQKGINAAVITPNEARAEEGRKALPGGDQLLVNGNMIPAGMAGRQAPGPTKELDQLLKTTEALQRQVGELARKSEPASPVHVHLAHPKTRHVVERDANGRAAGLADELTGGALVLLSEGRVVLASLPIADAGVSGDELVLGGELRARAVTRGRPYLAELHDASGDLVADDLRVGAEVKIDALSLVEGQTVRVLDARIRHG